MRVEEERNMEEISERAFKVKKLC